MKKILLSLAMGMTAIGASAQNSYNVRVGGASLGDNAAFTAMAQANISIDHYGAWTFSPAGQFAMNDIDMAGMLHANMGYRTRIGNCCFFAPKVGVAGGYFQSGDYGNAWLVGPSIDLTFEFKHFVIGLTGFYSFNTIDYIYNGYAFYEEGAVNMHLLSLTLGYTF